MNRKIVTLNVLLVALLGWLGWQLRAQYLESKAHEAEVLNRQAKAGAIIAPAPVPPVDAATSAAYIDVAQKTLFSKDRDPNVIIEATPPPPPPPEPPVPPMPKYFGQMAFGEPVIVLSTDQTPQKSYKVGDKIGEFTIASFDRENLTLTWREKTLKNSLRDLTPKEADRPAIAATPVASAAPAAPPKPTGPAPKGEAALGKANGAYRACLPNDPSPDGTVIAGFRKSIIPGMMGTTCQWEPVR